MSINILTLVTVYLLYRGSLNIRVGCTKPNHIQYGSHLANVNLLILNYNCLIRDRVTNSLSLHMFLSDR